MIDFFKICYDATRKPFVAVGRLGRLLTTILGLSLVAIWLVFAAILYESYSTEWRSATLFTSNVASLLEQDIARNIELYDLSLKSTVAAFEDPEVAKLPAALRQRVLFDRSANASGLGSTLLLDPTGAVIADSHSEVPRSWNGADQTFFKIHASGKFERELFISHPFKNPLQQDLWTIGLSRRLDNPDGSFAGIALGTLKLSYLANLFGSVEMPPGTSILLTNDDGTVLMRSPFAYIGNDVSGSEVFRRMSLNRSGSLIGRSSFDGVEKLFAYRRVGRLPVTLSISIPVSQFLDSWRWRMTFVAIGFAALSLLIGILAITLGTELQKRALAEQTLSNLAATDGLTALANRRHFDEILELEWRRAIRDRRPLAMLMIDGDFFKAYNDSYGHLEGDQALRAIAGALRDSIQRPADLVARFGGEEFSVLLPDTDLDGALAIAEGIRAAVSRLERAHVGSPFGRLTVSIGAASCLPLELGGALGLVQAADFALYEAKESGRDRVATGERLDLPAFGWRAARTAASKTKNAA